MSEKQLFCFNEIIELVCLAIDIVSVSIGPFDRVSEQVYEWKISNEYINQ